jgi:hypothetical protein
LKIMAMEAANITMILFFVSGDMLGSKVF